MSGFEIVGLLMLILGAVVLFGMVVDERVLRAALGVMALCVGLLGILVGIGVMWS